MSFLRWALPPVIGGVVSSVTFVYALQPPLVAIPIGIGVMAIVAYALRRRFLL